MIYFVISASQEVPGKGYRTSINSGVAARSIYKAMDLFSDKYPDATIHSIAKRGEIELGIVDGSAGK